MIERARGIFNALAALLIVMVVIFVIVFAVTFPIWIVAKIFGL